MLQRVIHSFLSRYAETRDAQVLYFGIFLLLLLGVLASSTTKIRSLFAFPEQLGIGRQKRSLFQPQAKIYGLLLSCLELSSSSPIGRQIQKT